MPVIDLASEIPYAAALSAEFIPTRCLFCFIPTKSNVEINKCKKCGVVFYCDQKCQEQDTFEHEPECRAYRNWKVAQRTIIDDPNAAYGDEKLRLLARLIRRYRRDAGNVDLTINKPTCVKPRKLSDLMSHRDNLLADPVRSVHLQDYATDLYGFFANTTEEMSPFYTTVDEIEELVGKMSINCFGIPLTTVDDEIHIGIAVYLTSSRFDHNCKPNLCMDFDGNKLIWTYFYQDENCKIPDFDKLYVSYGYTPTYAGYTAVATRQQRQLSLASMYYFQCQCQWCMDDTDASLSEAATTRLCKTCQQPFLLQPENSAKGFTLRPSCHCQQEDGSLIDCFEDDDAKNDLDKLIREWCTTFHPAPDFQSAMQAVSVLEPLRRLAHRYLHPSLNLRYVQINEILFHAYRAIALSRCPDWITPTVTIFPIPEQSSIPSEILARALVAGCLSGEMAVVAYEKRLDPHETVVARFCFQLAELYEMNGNMKGAGKSYQRALDIWKQHGSRGQEQCGHIQMCMERVSNSVVARKLEEGVKKVALEETRTENAPAGENHSQVQRKEKRKKKKKH